MDWTKIPTDLLQSRFSDKEILAITKYQLLWAMLERQPSDDVCLRYMTSKQLQQALNYMSAIECRVNADIKSVESHRKRQKLFYVKNQELGKKCDGQCDGNSDGQSAVSVSEQIRLDKIREDNNRFDEFWKKYEPVKGYDDRVVAKGSKSRCLDKYKKIIQKVEEQKIIDGVERYLNYCKRNKICSCGVEVFLNQRRWENEYPDENKSQMVIPVDMSIYDVDKDPFEA